MNLVYCQDCLSVTLIAADIESSIFKSLQFIHLKAASFLSYFDIFTTTDFMLHLHMLFTRINEMCNTLFR